LNFLESFFGCGILFFAECSNFNVESDDGSLKFLNFFRFTFLLKSQSTGSFINEINGLKISHQNPSQKINNNNNNNNNNKKFTFKTDNVNVEEEPYQGGICQ
jgi:hypothetical protein